MVEGLELPFYSSTPGVLGSHLSSFSLWCPVGGCAGDVAWRFSHHMSNPSASPSHDDDAHAVLVAVGEKMLVLGQNIRRILLRLLVWKVDSWLRSLSVILQHSEPYSRVGSTQLWYSISLVLVLYWDDCQTLFSILKTFLALLRRFLMSLPALPACLTVLPR